MLNLFVNTTCSFCAQRRDIPKRFAQTAARRVAARSLLGVHLVAERRHRGHSRGHVNAKPMSVEEARLVVDRDGLGLQKQYWIREVGFWDGLHQEERRTCNRDGSSNRCGVNITVRSDNQSWSGSHREHSPRGKFNPHVCVMSPSISHESPSHLVGDPSINNCLSNGSRQPASWSVSLAAHPVQRVPVLYS